jgi:glyceraldehyde 3-phosphate dehydrogenase
MSERKVRIAINGFGRIGRAFYKLVKDREDIEVIAVNDLGDPENMAYLLKYDTAYGRTGFAVSFVPATETEEAGFVVDGKKVILVQEKDATKLPWARLNIDIVIESTGHFTAYDKAQVHLASGAKRVVITAPAKGTPTDGVTSAMVLMGINHDVLSGCQISSNASCTTNAVSPVIQILHEKIGIAKALLNTTHAMTGTQAVVDGPGGKDARGGRAASANMIPASTGAAISVGEVITDMKGNFDGISIRVPVITGSIADVTFIAKRPTSVEEVNQILRDAAKEARWSGLFAVTEEDLVSSDIVGRLEGSIADLALTRVVGGDLVKVLAWYDNEMGYTNTLVKHVEEVARHL